MIDLSFFKNKKVFLTGHTGFKGAWLSKILVKGGALVTGYSLEPPTKPNLFDICDNCENMISVIGDIRDRDQLLEAFEQASPEIVIHMAAQPIVRESYNNPVYTYETNVMGTVNLLECIRLNGEPVRSVLIVTTDKVYRNNEWHWGYRERDVLDGYDPYSNSKSCAELVTHSYKRSFFEDTDVAISTARAGNVIGGGDFAVDRIVPDCVRAAVKGDAIVVRNQNSIRPYQHVLEPLFAYLLIIQKQYENQDLADSYNVGPDDIDCVTTGQLAMLFCEKWGKKQTWLSQSAKGPHEAGFLKLDCSKMKATFNWKPKWRVEQAIEKTVEWTKAYYGKDDILTVMDSQIENYLED